MLHEFLVKYRAEILESCRDKVLAASDSRSTSALLERGLPVFYDELTGVLRRAVSDPPVDASPSSESGISASGAAAHGKESLRLGYTISQVVHAYGAVCQSITEYIQIEASEVTPREFHDLNLCLDHAIAEAVTEFERGQSENVHRVENERLGCFIHELGSSLAAATVAYKMIQEGHVGVGGSTSRVLASAHERMRSLIERSMTEVRLRSGNVPVERTEVCLRDILSEVEASTLIMKSKGVRLTVDVDPALHLTADRHLVFSAVSNLVNNAMKFTKASGHVSVRGRESRGRVLIEVEDECGGLPEDKAEELLEPFVQKDADKSGMGLGLPLSRRAVELNQGKLTVRSILGKGCVFTIDFPNGGHHSLGSAS